MTTKVESDQRIPSPKDAGPSFTKEYRVGALIQLCKICIPENLV